MDSDYDPANIIEGKIGKYKFKTHKRFSEYYFNKNVAFENQSTHHVETLVKKGDTFIDVGAHHGYYSLVAAERVGSEGKIVAFEPVPENNRLLQENLAQIPPKTYQIFDCAVSDKSGSAQFNVPWASDSASLYKHPLAETLKIIKVPLKSIDELFPKEKIDFVKIDTEGNELKVLRGMRNTIEHNPDIKLLLEFNPECLESANTNPLELLDEINSLGLDIYVVDEENSATSKLVNNSRWKDYLTAVNYRNLLCVRSGTPSVLLFLHTSNRQGGELATVELAQRLQENGCIVTVSLPSGGPIVDYCKYHKVSTTYHKADWWLNKKVFALNTRQLELEKHILNYDYDSVIISTVASPFAAICSKRMGKHTIWYIHEDPSRFTYPYPEEDIVSYINEVADEILVPSEYLKSALVRNFPIFKRAQVLYPLPALENNKNKNRLLETNHTILMLGSIEKNKNQLDALRALVLINKTVTNVNLVLVGGADEVYKNELKDFIYKNKLDMQVRFVEAVDNPQVYMNEARIYLSCSFNEGFGRTIIEAMNAGTIVIAADSGGVRDYIKDRYNAYLYRAGDYKTLSKLIGEAISLKNGELVGGSRITISRLKETYTKQFWAFLDTLKKLSIGSDAIIFNDLNHKYLLDVEDTLNNLKGQLNEKSEKIKALESNYDKMHKDYVELIDTHQNIIGSKTWIYANKVRTLIKKNKK